MAAAYGALVSLMNDLDLIQNHPTYSFSFNNDQITSLSQIVNFLVNFMDRYDSHGYDRKAAEALEEHIAFAVADVAHHVIESHILDQILAKSTLLGKEAMQFGSTHGGQHFLDDLQNAIEEMKSLKRRVIKFIQESGLTMQQPYSAPPTSTEPLSMLFKAQGSLNKQFKAKSGVEVKQPTYSAPSTSAEPLTSAPGENLIGEFDGVADQLLNRLAGEPSNELVVIPIVGMGGIGKTTLVKYVYKSSLIKQHFDVRLWATISYDYDVNTTNLAKLLYGENVEELHKKLWGRRYLVVLDDMCDLRAWDEVQMYLPNNKNGSRVIVTTRLLHIATYLRHPPYNPIEMKFLDEDKSWELFCAKAFGREDSPVDELEKIGKKIVRKCGGLPLSIVVIGGHLRRSSRDIEYWEKVSNSMNPISSSGAKDNECFEILSLSYRHLPPCLKPCFLYMGFFKEDEQINVSKLLRLWVAEGFVGAIAGQTLEKVAEDYLNDLIERNLILVGERRWNGKVESCFIHDILRELCSKIAKKEKFVSVLATTIPSVLHIFKARGDVEVPRIVIPETMCGDFLRFPYGEDGRNILSDAEYDSLLFEMNVLRAAHSLRCQGAPSFEEKLSLRSLLVRGQRRLRVSVNVQNILLKNEICLPDAHSQHFNLRYLAFSSKKLATTGNFRNYFPFFSSKKLATTGNFRKRPYFPFFSSKKLATTGNFRKRPYFPFFSSKKLATTGNFRKRPYFPSLSLFWNMQSIDVNNFDVQISATNEIWEMSQLRHLVFRGFYLPDPPPGDGSNQQKCIVLENLQTLVGVENFRSTEEVCRRMPNIKELSVFYDHFPEDCEASSYYCPHNLDRFGKLESLKCEFGDDSMFPPDRKWREVVRNFTFPSSLEELFLWNSNIHWEDLTGMIKSLPNLISFKLNSVQGI